MKVQAQNPHAQEVPRDAPPSGDPQPGPSHDLSLRSPTTHDPKFANLIDLITRNYVPDEELHLCSNISDELAPRICGSWVEVLPHLNDWTGNDVVSTALTALGTAIMPERLSGDVHNIDSTRTYLTAIQAMQKGLSSANIYSDRELLVSIMCLSLAEVCAVVHSRFTITITD